LTQEQISKAYFGMPDAHAAVGGDA